MANCLDVLESLAVSAGLAYDPILARQVVRRVERELSGSTAETWFERLERAGAEIGLRVTHVRRSIRDAAAMAIPEAPLVTYAAGPDGEGRWVYLAGHRLRKVRLAGLAEGEEDRWMSRSRLARLLGVGSTSEPVEWAVAEVVAPCEALRARPAEGGHHDDIPLWRRLMRLLRPDRREIRVILTFAVFVGVLSLAIPMAVEALVTTVAMSLLVQQLIVVTLILFVCLAFGAMLRAFQVYVAEIIQQRLFIRVASDLAFRLPRVRIDAYDHSYGPELVNRFFEVVTVQKVVSLILLDGVTLVLQGFVGLLVLAFYHPYLLGYDIVLMATMGFIIYNLGRGAVATSVKESKAKYLVADRLEELARSPLGYKLGGHDLPLDRTDALARHYLLARRKHFRILFRQIVFALGLQVLASTVLLGLGGWLVMRGQLTLGQLVAAELIVTTIAGSFAKLGKHLEGFYDLMASVDKLGHLVDLPLERGGGEVHHAPAGGAELRLHGVSFDYDGHHEVLRELDLTVLSGERVAIVGPSGSGKSTLVDLLFGLRAPESGYLELDGVDIRDLRLESLREHVAVVKGVEVIEGTVLENVRMGREAISVAEARRALAAVGLLEEVSALLEGIHTPLLTGGAPLSQGQARRLMLARAMAGMPRLLVIDEALDGLDIDARRRIMDALFDRNAPWTLIVITHSPDVARRCDRTLSLSGGKADEVGAAAIEEIRA